MIVIYLYYISLEIPKQNPIDLKVTFHPIACQGDSKKNYHMRKTDEHTVCSGSLSIANDGSEPQFFT